MPLTDNAVRSAKAAAKPYKLFDRDGLYLIVNPTGSKWWRFKYQFGGREKLLSLGIYNDVSLKDARAKRDDARKLVAAKTDPSNKRKVEKIAHADTFKAIAEEWLTKQSKTLSAETVRAKRSRLETWAYRSLGGTPISQIEAPELLAMLQRIEATDRNETAHRVRQACSGVFRHAILSHRARRDPTADLRGALVPVVTEHHAAVTDPAAVGALLRAIDGYSGTPATELALQIAPYVFVRPGELRAAEWSEFDLSGDHPEWRIPAERMKMKRAHIVPLARQTAALVRKLEAHTAGGKYLFPTSHDPTRPMSENTLSAALRVMGYTSDVMTPHGFRTIASTLLNERGFNPELIELQLAHVEGSEVRAAYNRSVKLAERRTMMQAWADHLDGLRSPDKKVVALGSGRRA
jgi:integrase